MSDSPAPAPNSTSPAASAQKPLCGVLAPSGATEISDTVHADAGALAAQEA